MTKSGSPLLSLEDLRVEFSRKGHSAPIRAVDGISFNIEGGETIGLVGESGCGKSSLARASLMLIPITSGTISFRGERLNGLSGRDLRRKRREMQMIFQDPLSSLDPRMKAWKAVAEPLGVHRAGTRNERRTRARDLLELVGIPHSAHDKYPGEFSGGQRQRIAIARALALGPALVVCDEPVSALDVSIQAQILNLLQDLQEQFELTYLFIAHDLTVVEHISRRVLVMYLGRIVETVPADELTVRPLHPYTKALVSAIPDPEPDAGSTKRRILLKGDPPSPSSISSGCRFRTRCSFVMDICSEIDPVVEAADEEHTVACHRWRELESVSDESWK